MKERRTLYQRSEVKCIFLVFVKIYNDFCENLIKNIDRQVLKVKKKILVCTMGSSGETPQRASGNQSV